MMGHEDKTTASSTNSEGLIILHEMKVAEDAILFFFNKSNFNVWLENVNKHIPEVYELKKTDANVFCFFYTQLPKNFSRHSLKLSVSNDTDRLHYFAQSECFTYFENATIEAFCERKEDSLVLLIENTNKFLQHTEVNLFYLNHESSSCFEKVDSNNIPIKIGVIGTCFSRSVFRSDKFFNPGYKRFFTVPLTFFHNSFISLMSDRVEDKDYQLITDLLSNEVRRYIEIEFLKNVKQRISSAEIEYIIVDNYSDSTHEAVEMSRNSFLTYNKYFSESIYKRKFTGKEIFVPGELKHIEKYRESVKRFHLVLQELNLDKKVILIGGRLSLFKTQLEYWESKIDWIKKTNYNWNICDRIFMEQIPGTKYIDMRSTNWISDLNTPIIGGSSPSHYQSGFYKEIYDKILKTVFKD